MWVKIPPRSACDRPPYPSSNPTPLCSGIKTAGPPFWPPSLLSGLVLSRAPYYPFSATSTSFCPLFPPRPPVYKKIGARVRRLSVRSPVCEGGGPRDGAQAHDGESTLQRSRTAAVRSFCLCGFRVLHPILFSLYLFVLERCVAGEEWLYPVVCKTGGVYS